MKKRYIALICILMVALIAAVGDLMVRQSIEGFFAGMRDSVFSQLGALFTRPRLEKPDPKTYSEYFVTCANASAVAQSVLKLGPAVGIPENSGKVPTLNPNRKTDAWGHPFCLVGISDQIIVISLGPGRDAFPGCSNLGTDLALSKQMPVGILNRLPSGHLVLVVKRRPDQKPSNVGAASEEGHPAGLTMGAGWYYANNQLCGGPSFTSP